MRIVSLSIGSAESTATIKTLRPLILEIDFKGRATLKVLSPDTLKPPSLGGSPGVSTVVYSVLPPSRTIDTYPIMTMKKSKIFHSSRM